MLAAAVRDLFTSGTKSDADVEEIPSAERDQEIGIHTKC